MRSFFSHIQISYLVLFLLLSTFTAASISRIANASELNVTATVLAPLPDSAPSISEPISNTIVTTSTVALRGTCPVVKPAVVIAVYEGEYFLGSGRCTTLGTFSIPITLSYGTHSFVVTVETITGQTGASSPVTSITRPIPESTDSSIHTSTTPLIGFTAINKFVTLDAKNSVVWQGLFNQIDSPYSLRINWGDGKTITSTVTDTNAFALEHTYPEKAHYDIFIQATSQNGMQSSMHIAAQTFAQVNDDLPKIKAEAQLPEQLTNHSVVGRIVTMYQLLYQTQKSKS